jgi:DNA repair protein RadA/Sms
MASAKKNKEGTTQACRRCSANFSADKMQCPSCSFWNTVVITSPDDDKTILLSEATAAVVKRISTGPWDACWGFHVDDDGMRFEGTVTSSVTLLGGVPGAGKSTLALQLANTIADTTQREVLYISAEESNAEIRARAKRLKLQNLDKIRLIPIGVSVELGGIMMHRKPVALIADSLPKIAPDPADAVIFCEKLKGYAIELECPVIIIDHVTKEEELAGLMALQHAVDTTLLFTVYEDGVRELKTIKNRNGPSGTRVFLNMTETGLQLRDEEEDEDILDEDNDGLEGDE